MRQLMTFIRRLTPIAGVLEGYDNPELTEVIFRKTVDYSPKSPWPEMAGVSSVLDFGGGCGLHYRQARSSIVRWAVVETPQMAARAAELATDRLRFFTSIADAVGWLGAIEVMYSNSVLQYTTEPEETLGALCALRARKMIWERLALSPSFLEKEIQHSRLSDNGPGKIRIKEKLVKYERTKIPEAAFLAAHSAYDLTERGSDWFRFALR